MSESMKVWIDGQVVAGDEARVPVTDHGLLYGDGVFEGMRVYGRRIFRLADHMRRIGTGARALGLTIPGGTEALAKIVVETAQAFGKDEAYLRLVVTRGSGALGVDPTTCVDPRVFCIIDHISLYPAERLTRGIDMLTSSLRRPAPDVLDPRVKSLNYLNSVLAKREARVRGADEALMLNDRGLVAEAAVANVFAVLRGVLTTPPVTDGALEGITRASVLEIAEEQGMATSERSLGRADLFGASEVFLTGSGARIAPVGTLDDAPIGEPGAHPVADKIMAAFPAFAEAHGTLF